MVNARVFWAHPSWAQSLPTRGMMCPKTSLFVMVPSTSETTTLSFHSHRKSCADTSCLPSTRVL